LLRCYVGRCCLLGCWLRLLLRLLLFVVVTSRDPVTLRSVPLLRCYGYVPTTFTLILIWTLHWFGYVTVGLRLRCCCGFTLRLMRLTVTRLRLRLHFTFPRLRWFVYGYVATLLFAWLRLRLRYVTFVTLRSVARCRLFRTLPHTRLRYGYVCTVGLRWLFLTRTWFTGWIRLVVTLHTFVTLRCYTRLRTLRLLRWLVVGLRFTLPRLVGYGYGYRWICRILHTHTRFVGLIPVPHHTLHTRTHTHVTAVVRLVTVTFTFPAAVTRLRYLRLRLVAVCARLHTRLPAGLLHCYPRLRLVTLHTTHTLRLRLRSAHVYVTVGSHGYVVTPFPFTLRSAVTHVYAVGFYVYGYVTHTHTFYCCVVTHGWLRLVVTRWLRFLVYTHTLHAHVYGWTVYVYTFIYTCDFGRFPVYVYVYVYGRCCGCVRYTVTFVHAVTLYVMLLLLIYHGYGYTVWFYVTFTFVTDRSRLLRCPVAGLRWFTVALVTHHVYLLLVTVGYVYVVTLVVGYVWCGYVTFTFTPFRFYVYVYGLRYGCYVAGLFTFVGWTFTAFGYGCGCCCYPRWCWTFVVGYVTDVTTLLLLICWCYVVVGCYVCWVLLIPVIYVDLVVALLGVCWFARLFVVDVWFGCVCDLRLFVYVCCSFALLRCCYVWRCCVCPRRYVPRLRCWLRLRWFTLLRLHVPTFTVDTLDFTRFPFGYVTFTLLICWFTFTLFERCYTLLIPVRLRLLRLRSRSDLLIYVYVWVTFVWLPDVCYVVTRCCLRLHLRLRAVWFYVYIRYGCTVTFGCLRTGYAGYTLHLLHTVTLLRYVWFTDVHTLLRCYVYRLVVVVGWLRLLRACYVVVERLFPFPLIWRLVTHVYGLVWLLPRCLRFHVYVVALPFPVPVYRWLRVVCYGYTFAVYTLRIHLRLPHTRLPRLRFTHTRLHWFTRTLRLRFGCYVYGWFTVGFCVYVGCSFTFTLVTLVSRTRYVCVPVCYVTFGCCCILLRTRLRLFDYVDLLRLHTHTVGWLRLRLRLVTLRWLLVTGYVAPRWFTFTLLPRFIYTFTDSHVTLGIVKMDCAFRVGYRLLIPRYRLVTLRYGYVTVTLIYRYGYGCYDCWSLRLLLIWLLIYLFTGVTVVTLLPVTLIPDVTLPGCWCCLLRYTFTRCRWLLRCLRLIYVDSLLHVAVVVPHVVTLYVVVVVTFAVVVVCLIYVWFVVTHVDFVAFVVTFTLLLTVYTLPTFVVVTLFTLICYVAVTFGDVDLRCVCLLLRLLRCCDCPVTLRFTGRFVVGWFDLIVDPVVRLVRYVDLFVCYVTLRFTRWRCYGLRWCVAFPLLLLLLVTFTLRLRWCVVVVVVVGAFVVTFTLQIYVWFTFVVTRLVGLRFYVVCYVVGLFTFTPHAYVTFTRTTHGYTHTRLHTRLVTHGWVTRAFPVCYGYGWFTVPTGYGYVPVGYVWLRCSLRLVTGYTTPFGWLLLVYTRVWVTHMTLRVYTRLVTGYALHIGYGYGCCDLPHSVTVTRSLIAVTLVWIRCTTFDYATPVGRCWIYVSLPAVYGSHGYGYGYRFYTCYVCYTHGCTYVTLRWVCYGWLRFTLDFTVTFTLLIYVTFGYVYILVPTLRSARLVTFYVLRLPHTHTVTFTVALRCCRLHVCLRVCYVVDVTVAVRLPRLVTFTGYTVWFTHVRLRLVTTHTRSFTRYRTFYGRYILHTLRRWFTPRCCLILHLPRSTFTPPRFGCWRYHTHRFGWRYLHVDLFTLVTLLWFTFVIYVVRLVDLHTFTVVGGYTFLVTVDLRLRYDLVTRWFHLPRCYVYTRLCGYTRSRSGCCYVRVCYYVPTRCWLLRWFWLHFTLRVVVGGYIYTLRLRLHVWLFYGPHVYVRLRRYVYVYVGRLRLPHTFTFGYGWLRLRFVPVHVCVPGWFTLVVVCCVCCYVVTVCYGWFVWRWLPFGCWFDLLLLLLRCCWLRCYVCCRLFDFRLRCWLHTFYTLRCPVWFVDLLRCYIYGYGYLIPGYVWIATFTFTFVVCWLPVGYTFAYVYDLIYGYTFTFGFYVYVGYTVGCCGYHTFYVPRSVTFTLPTVTFHVYVVTFTFTFYTIRCTRTFTRFTFDSHTFTFGLLIGWLVTHTVVAVTDFDVYTLHLVTLLRLPVLRLLRLPVTVVDLRFWFPVTFCIYTRCYGYTCGYRCTFDCCCYIALRWFTLVGWFGYVWPRYTLFDLRCHGYVRFVTFGYGYVCCYGCPVDCYGYALTPLHVGYVYVWFYVGYVYAHVYGYRLDYVCHVWLPVRSHVVTGYVCWLICWLDVVYVCVYVPVTFTFTFTLLLFGCCSFGYVHVYVAIYVVTVALFTLRYVGLRCCWFTFGCYVVVTLLIAFLCHTVTFLVVTPVVVTLPRLHVWLVTFTRLHLRSPFTFTVTLQFTLHLIPQIWLHLLRSARVYVLPVCSRFPLPVTLRYVTILHSFRSVCYTHHVTFTSVYGLVGYVVVVTILVDWLFTIGFVVFPTRLPVGCCWFPTFVRLLIVDVTFTGCYAFTRCWFTFTFVTDVVVPHTLILGCYPVTRLRCSVTTHVWFVVTRLHLLIVCWWIRSPRSLFDLLLRWLNVVVTLFVVILLLLRWFGLVVVTLRLLLTLHVTLLRLRLRLRLRFTTFYTLRLVGCWLLIYHSVTLPVYVVTFTFTIYVVGCWTRVDLIDLVDCHVVGYLPHRLHFTFTLFPFTRLRSLVTYVYVDLRWLRYVCAILRLRLRCRSHVVGSLPFTFGHDLIYVTVVVTLDYGCCCSPLRLHVVVDSTFTRCYYVYVVPITFTVDSRSVVDFTLVVVTVRLPLPVVTVWLRYVAVTGWICVTVTFTGSRLLLPLVTVLRTHTRSHILPVTVDLLPRLLRLRLHHVGWLVGYVVTVVYSLPFAFTLRLRSVRLRSYVLYVYRSLRLHVPTFTLLVTGYVTFTHFGWLRWRLVTRLFIYGRLLLLRLRFVGCYGCYTFTVCGCYILRYVTLRLRLLRLVTFALLLLRLPRCPHVWFGYTFTVGCCCCSLRLLHTLRSHTFVYGYVTHVVDTLLICLIWFDLRLLHTFTVTLRRLICSVPFTLHVVDSPLLIYGLRLLPRCLGWLLLIYDLRLHYVCYVSFTILIVGCYHVYVYTFCVYVCSGYGWLLHIRCCSCWFYVCSPFPRWFPFG